MRSLFTREKGFEISSHPETNLSFGKLTPLTEIMLKGFSKYDQIDFDGKKYTIKGDQKVDLVNGHRVLVTKEGIENLILFDDSVVEDHEHYLFNGIMMVKNYVFDVDSKFDRASDIERFDLNSSYKRNWFERELKRLLIDNKGMPFSDIKGVLYSNPVGLVKNLEPLQTNDSVIGEKSDNYEGRLITTVTKLI